MVCLDVFFSIAGFLITGRYVTSLDMSTGAVAGYCWFGAMSCDIWFLKLRDPPEIKRIAVLHGLLFVGTLGNIAISAI